MDRPLVVGGQVAHGDLGLASAIATVRTADRTGIEMEALTAVTVAALTVIDMVKGVDKMVAIRECYVEEKSGGRSGTWTRSAR